MGQHEEQPETDSGVPWLEDEHVFLVDEGRAATPAEAQEPWRFEHTQLMWRLRDEDEAL